MQTLFKSESLIFDPPPSDCVLYLTGLPGGNGKIHDRSPWGNHGGITGAIWKKLSNGLWHLGFDGSDDYVSVPDAFSLDFGNKSFTVRLWFYLKGACGDLIGKYQSYQTGNWGFSIKDAAAIRFYNDSGSPEMAADNLADGWQCLTFIVNREDNRVYLYQQSCLKDSVSFTPQTFSNSVNLTIGKYSSAQWGSLFCDIALCSIHKRALSGLEIQNAFDREKNLFGVWNK